MKLLGEIGYIILNRCIKNWDYKAWLKEYGERLVADLLDKVEFDTLDDKLQDKLLDKVKKWAEKVFKVNL